MIAPFPLLRGVFAPTNNSPVTPPIDVSISRATSVAGTETVAAETQLTRRRREWRRDGARGHTDNHVRTGPQFNGLHHQELANVNRCSDYKVMLSPYANAISFRESY